MSQTKNEFPWQAGVAVICQKCGLSFETPFSGEEMRKELKTEFRDLGLSAAIRVTSSTCLGVCNPAEQTVGYFPIDGKPEVVSFSGDHIKDQVKQYLIGKASKSS